MGFFERVGWVLALGAVVAFGAALIHPLSGIRLGGDKGFVYPSWLILIGAPLVVIAGLRLAAYGRARAKRRRRYIPTSELPRD